MNQRTTDLMLERFVKTQAVVDLLGRTASLYHEIMDSTKELADIARDSNPDRKMPAREMLSTIGADRFSTCIESSLKSLLVHEPPIDLLAECVKGNNTLRLTIGGN